MRTGIRTAAGALALGLSLAGCTPGAAEEPDGAAASEIWSGGCPHSASGNWVVGRLGEIVAKLW